MDGAVECVTESIVWPGFIAGHFTPNLRVAAAGHRLCHSAYGRRSQDHCPEATAGMVPQRAFAQLYHVPPVKLPSVLGTHVAPWLRGWGVAW